MSQLDLEGNPKTTKPADIRCGTCAYFQPPKHYNGKPNLERDARGLCCCPFDVSSDLPAWVTIGGYRSVTRYSWRNCPAWEKRKRKHD